MTRMVPTILRFEATPPDCAELRYFLRHAGALLGASEIDGPGTHAMLMRARAWMLAAIEGLDQLVRASRLIDPAAPDRIADRDTETHDVSNLGLPTLVPPRGDRR
jgi:hypothetical protein